MPRTGRQHGNACTSDEIEYLTPPPVAAAAPKRKRRKSESDRLVDPPTEPRLINRDVKVLILQGFTDWLDRGSPRDGTLMLLSKNMDVERITRDACTIRSSRKAVSITSGT